MMSLLEYILPAGAWITLIAAAVYCYKIARESEK
jgi:hypothetical protein